MARGTTKKNIYFFYFFHVIIFQMGAEEGIKNNLVPTVFLPVREQKGPGNEVHWK